MAFQQGRHEPAGGAWQDVLVALCMRCCLVAFVASVDVLMAAREPSGQGQGRHEPAGGARLPGWALRVILLLMTCYLVLVVFVDVVLSAGEPAGQRQDRHEPAGGALNPEV
jgi:ABC-type Fe3+ transport system permease subunit